VLEVTDETVSTSSSSVLGCGAAPIVSPAIGDFVVLRHSSPSKPGTLSADLAMVVTVDNVDAVSVVKWGDLNGDLISVAASQLNLDPVSYRLPYTYMSLCVSSGYNPDIRSRTVQRHC
jgi:hypothetical protein